MLLSINADRADYDVAKAKAVQLFSQIDANDSGAITEEEMINCIEEMYNQHVHLSLGLSTHEMATKAVEIVIACVYFFLILFVVLFILELDVTSFYTSLATFFALWSFALSTR